MYANHPVIDQYPVAAVLLAAAATLSLLLVLLRTRRGSRRSVAVSEDRLDTMQGWPPASRRVFSRVERRAFATLKRAVPEFMVLAQVPVARFLAVPRDNSYHEWMRRLGGHCVDLVVCDGDTQVLAVVIVRPAEADVTELLRRRFERLPRSLAAAGIPVVTWHADSLPSIDAARASVSAHLRSAGATPAVAEPARLPLADFDDAPDEAETDAEWVPFPDRQPSPAQVQHA